MPLQISMKDCTIILCIDSLPWPVVRNIGYSLRTLLPLQKLSFGMEYIILVISANLFGTQILQYTKMLAIYIDSESLANEHPV